MDTNNSIKISVLMPVYNGEKYIKKAIESILNQSYTNFEFIIINDGSTDKSEQIIKSYNDYRIRFINNAENKGLISTLNEGLKKATGKYIARMDQDDISLPYRFEKQYTYLEKNPDISLIGSFAELINANDKRIGIKECPIEYSLIKFHLIYHNPFIHSSIFFRREDIIKLGEYNKNYEHAEDYELYSRIIKKYKIANIPIILLKYRIHEQCTGYIPERKRIQEINCEKIFFNNINNYIKIEWNDFMIYKKALFDGATFKNFINSLHINQQILQNFIKKEKIQGKRNTEILHLYKEKRKIIIKKLFLRYLKISFSHKNNYYEN